MTDEEIRTLIDETDARLARMHDRLSAEVEHLSRAIGYLQTDVAEARRIAEDARYTAERGR